MLLKMLNGMARLSTLIDCGTDPMSRAFHGFGDFCNRGLRLRVHSFLPLQRSLV